MEDWDLKPSDLKKYPHFDPLISSNEATSLANNETRVATHKFYPFMLFEQRWNRFNLKGDEGQPKIRPIRYAARADAYIFARYRHVLSEKYETELQKRGLQDCILAYRRIREEHGDAGKCNIHFARDAVNKIRDLENCCVVALDISSYFESLDHQILKSLWAHLLGGETLPADHYQVFKAITQYAVVDKKSVYERLGHFGVKRRTKAGKPINGYLTPYKDIPRQLCTGSEFRQKIAGGDGTKSIIRKNLKPYGIPQGAPISDLLANLYLIDFDEIILGWVTAVGGAYFRYSDDILIIIPGGELEGRKMMQNARALICNFGSELAIKEQKSSIFVFNKNGEHQDFDRVHGTQGKNGLEYLGFRYNGKNVYLRDSTISSLRRKVARAAQRDAHRCARRYPNKDLDELKSVFNYERLIKQFGRVENFGELHGEYRNWTFWTYAKRAAKIFGPIGKPILRQLRRHNSLIHKRADYELGKAVARRDKALLESTEPN